MNQQKFDEIIKGRYVSISSNGAVARRQFGFCDALALSTNYVLPGEVIAVEIIETQPGWSGDLRLGFTLLSNDDLLPLPSLAVPELVSRGRSWLVPIGTAAAFLVSRKQRAYWRLQQKIKKSTFRRTRSPTGLDTENVYSDQSTISTRSEISRSTFCEPYRRTNRSARSPCLCCLATDLGRIPLNRLMPIQFTGFRLPDVEKGSVVAIYYELVPLSSDENELEDERVSFYSTSNISDVGISSRRDELLQSRSSDENHAFQFRFHLVINGVDFVAVVEKIVIGSPNTQLTDYVNLSSGSIALSSHTYARTMCSIKFRAVFDVYGQTKAVRIVNLEQQQLPYLSHLCTCTVLNHLYALHLPGEFSWTNVGHPQSFKFPPHGPIPTYPLDQVEGDVSVSESVTIPDPRYLTSPDQHPSRCPSPFRDLCRAIFRLPLPQSELYRLHLITCAMVARRQNSIGVNE